MNRPFLSLLAGMAIPVALGLAGCTMAPKYVREKAPVPAEWPAGEVYSGSSRVETNAPAAGQLAWQEFFSDPHLQTLIAIGLTNNRDLRVSALNVERVRALYRIQRAQLLPTVDAVASGSKERIPGDLSDGGQARTVSQYGVDLGVAAWEIDFFGRIRSLKDRALQEYLASEQARRSAQILLVSSIADVFLALAADRESLGLAVVTLESQEKARQLIQRRHQLGLIPELDLFRVQTQVETARRDVAQYRQRVAQDENSLSFLTGRAAPTELLPLDLARVTAPLELHAGLPSDVLLDRPDVRQAENLLQAAYADIGAARATFFPRISLTAAFGTASSELSGLFKAGSGAWSFAPQIVMPIFDARTWSALKASKVQREIAVAEYERAVQNAFREVADALAVRGTVGQQVAAQEALVHSVSETYRLSTSRYDKGIDSYLSVLDAQRSLYAAQQGLVSLRLAAMANQVRLYAVLGGGWQSRGPSLAQRP